MHEQGLMGEYRTLRGAVRRPSQASDQQRERHMEKEKEKEREVVQQPQAHGKCVSLLIFFFPNQALNNTAQSALVFCFVLFCFNSRVALSE